MWNERNATGDGRVQHRKGIRCEWELARIKSVWNTIMNTNALYAN